MRTSTRFVGPTWSALVVLTALAALLPAPAARAAQGKMTFEIYEDARKEHRWRLKAANGQILATAGEGYKAKADAKKAVEQVKANAATDKAAFEFYEDAKKEHRWRLKAANGQIVAAASEGYKAKADAEKAVEQIKKGAKDAAVEEK